MSDTTITTTVPDDSILASKQLTIRPVTQMKLRQLRQLRALAQKTKQLDTAALTDEQAFSLMDDMSDVLTTMLMGWTRADVEELSIDEMTLIIKQISGDQRAALPKATSSRSTRRTARGTGTPGRAG